MSNHYDRLSDAMADYSRTLRRPEVGALRQRAERRRRMRRVAASVAVVAAAAGLAFVVTNETIPFKPSGAADLGPVLTHEPLRPYPLAEFKISKLTLVDGCLLADGKPVVWPLDTKWDAAENAVILNRHGTEIRITVGSGSPTWLGGGLIPYEGIKEGLSEPTRTMKCLDYRARKTDSLLIIDFGSRP